MSSRSLVPLLRRCLLLACALAPLSAVADLRVLVVDQDGLPLANAVVESRHEALQQVPGEIAVIDQINKRFVPMVIAIAQGQSVNFPNNDNIRHHVYSFSPIRQFSTELYADVHGDPILFDQPGIAVLGCNIHDSMVGYIYVSEFAHVAVTDAQGSATLSMSTLPPSLSIWHPWSADPDNRREINALEPDADGTLRVQLNVRQPDQVFGFRALTQPQSGVSP